MNVNVICTFHRDEAGFNGVSSINTVIYFALGCVWFAATSITRNGRGITAWLHRHFKTNHRLAYPSCPHMDRQILGPGSLIFQSPRRVYYSQYIHVGIKRINSAYIQYLSSCFCCSGSSWTSEAWLSVFSGDGERRPGQVHSRVRDSPAVRRVYRAFTSSGRGSHTGPDRPAVKRLTETQRS